VSKRDEKVKKLKEEQEAKAKFKKEFTFKPDLTLTMKREKLPTWDSPALSRTFNDPLE